MVVSVIFPLRQQLFCWSIKPPYSTISLTQDYLECPCSYWMDGPFCISFLAFAQTSPSCVFLEEPIWSAMALPSYIPWDTIAFSFLMTFAQSSISDMFQHRNQCWSRSQWQDLLLFIWMMNEMQRMQFEDLTGQYLAERGVNFVLNGQSKNEGLEGLVVQENLQLIWNPQKPCLWLILIQFILGPGIWRGTLTYMGKYWT